MLKVEFNGVTKLAEEGGNYPKLYPHQTVIESSSVGIGEVWGDNLKGDYFPRSEIVGNPEGTYGYKTFVTNGHVYYRHIKNTVSDIIGTILNSYISPIERVNVVQVINNDKINPDVVEDLNNNGGKYGVSMGTSVPYDVCSFCGHKSYNGLDRCEHIPLMIRQFINGIKVYMINVRPVFNDNSLTPIPADESGVILAKVASVGIDKGSDIQKQLVKELPIVQASDQDLIPILSQLFIKNPVLEKNKSALLSVISKIGVVLSPKEYSMFDNAQPLSLPTGNAFDMLPRPLVLRSILRNLLFSRVLTGQQRVNTDQELNNNYVGYRKILAILTANRLQSMIRDMFQSRKVYGLLDSIPNFAHINTAKDSIMGLPLRYMLYSYNNSPDKGTINKLAQSFYPIDMRTMINGGYFKTSDSKLLTTIL